MSLHRGRCWLPVEKGGRGWEAGVSVNLEGSAMMAWPAVHRLPLPSRSRFPFTRLCKLKPSSG